MPPSSQRTLAQRLLLACVALLFLLQPLALGASGCALRAALSGQDCCCTQAAEPVPTSDCCSKHDAPAPKRCGCELSAPPLVPPGGATELPKFLGELAGLHELPVAAPVSREREQASPCALAPPGFRSCFHTLLGAGMARALAFERTLRC